jgi:hypothetical protein
MNTNNSIIREVLTNYKSRIAQSRMQDEVYKWELIAKFKGRPDTNASDFAAEYKAVKYGNLMYQLAGGVGNHICKGNSEEFRDLFVYLFDESKSLNDRVNYFNEESLKLYRSIGGVKGHHQDERTISAYLTFQNPEKYTIYKSTFYKEFCKLMNDAPAGKNEKYGHYLDLLNQFIEEYINPDKELIEQVKSYIPDYYDGSNHLLLAQDILYCMLDKRSNDLNYWIFQGNPNQFDFDTALRENILSDWTVSAHKDKIKPGDKVILWITGKAAGCYALAEVTSEPYEKEQSGDSHLWITEDKNNIKVDIKITHNWVDEPILKVELENEPTLKNLKVGHQGTNFGATEKEYKSLMAMQEGNPVFKDFVKHFEHQDLDAYFGLLKEISNRFNLKKNDQRLVFNMHSNRRRFSFTVSQRYCLSLNAHDQRGKFGFLTKDKLFKNSEQFEGNLPRPWYTHTNELIFTEEEKQNIFDGIEIELNRSNVSGFRKYNKADFEDYILGNVSFQRKYWLFAPGEGASLWDEFYHEGIMALGWDQLGDLNQYKTKEEISQELNFHNASEVSKSNDSLANYEFKNVMSVGDVIIVKRGLHEFLGYGLVTSDYYFDDNRLDYKSCRKVDWKKNGLWTDPEHKTVLKTLTKITKDKAYVERLKELIGIENDTMTKEVKNPLNQILYGPPGTGKTYTLKTEYFPLYTTTEAAITKDAHFENAVRDCSWWQVIAVALIQLGKSKVSAIAEHPWVVQKTNLSNSKTVRPTIWGQLQSHTIDSCEFVNVKSKQQPFIFNKTEDSYWEILEEEVKEQIPEIYELIDSVENFKPNPNKEIKRYVFTTFHQSFSYEDFIEGIKPIMSDEDGTGEVAYRIEDGVFKDLCKRAESDPNNRYAIFIDEINRGNVSAIFGELITLIETDKRKGAEHAMNAILPYSKAPFSVPVNVDIYGTMNTADRSVEALDTALRRRFSFTEMPPIYDIDEEKATLQYTYAGVVGSKLLETINNRIEKLLDRDHLIGHSYFLMAKGEDAEAKLIDSFYRNIIPLLQEYFYGDYAKIGAVLGSGFVFKNQEDSVIFGDGFNEEEYSDKDIYQIIDYRVANNPLIKTDMSFESAIQKLMNTPKEKASEPGA